jgi:hypothetical protein
MNDVSAHEKRAMRRFALELPVVVTAAAGETLQATAKTRDVSSHGICFYCDAPMEHDTPIEFTLTLPAEVTMTEPISVRCCGKVVRVEKDQVGSAFAIAAAISSYEFIASDERQKYLAATDAQSTL